MLFHIIPKNSKCTYSIEKRNCLHFGILSLHSKIVQPILGVQASCQGNLKYLEIFFSFSFSFSSLLLFFNKAKGPLLLSSSSGREEPVHLGLVVDPAQVEQPPRASFLSFSPSLAAGSHLAASAFPFFLAFPLRRERGQR